MKVRVTEQDIKLGNYQSWGCPVALAIARASRRKGVFAGLGWIVFRNGQRFPTPNVVRMFIEDYDADRRVKPFTFELALPK